MTEYDAPVTDMAFVLTHVVDYPGVAALDDFGHCRPRHGVRCARGVRSVHGRGRRAAQPGRRHEGSRINATAPSPRRPDSRRRTAAYVDAGWGAVPFPPDYGGGGFPWLVGIVMQEMIDTAPTWRSRCARCSPRAPSTCSLHHGSEEQQERLPAQDGHRRVDRHDEPHRARRPGSDVGRRCAPRRSGRTTARTASPARRSSSPSASTTWPTTSSTSCWPAPPTRRRAPRASRCFIVPEVPASNDDGSLGERNDVTLRVDRAQDGHPRPAPPACCRYGEQGDGAVGYLIGEENAGHALHVHDDEQRPPLGRASRASAIGRAGLPARAAVRPGAPAGPGPGRAGRRAVARSSSTPTCAACCCTMKAYDRGAARRSSTPPPPRIDLATAPPRRGRAATGPQELVDLLTPIVQGAGAPTSASR